MHRLNYILHCKHGGEDVLPEQWNFFGGNSNKRYTNFLTPPPLLSTACKRIESFSVIKSREIHKNSASRSR